MKLRLPAEWFFGLLATINLTLFIFFFFTNTYPWPFVIIHGVTIVLLLTQIFDPKRMMKNLAKHKVDFWIVVALCVVAFAIRIYKVDQITPGMWGDEVGYAILGEQIVDSHTFVPFSNDLFAPPTPFLYLIGLTVKTLGRTLVTVRLPAIIFGALGVGACYIFLRSIFERPLALAGALVMLVLYQHIILSRFAYEMSAAVFFLFLTLTFLYRAYRYQILTDYMSAVICLAGGLYTYLAFRTNAIAIFLIITIMVLRKQEIMKERIYKLIVIYITFFMALMPWLAFSLSHPDHVMARAKAISVFHQNLPPERVVREILGNAQHSFGMFFMYGDPNPRQNPANDTMYDPLFVGLAILGLIYLFKKQKALAFTGLFFMIPSFVNDIFSIEIFPEFHYYGTGHPSATRVLGLIPIMIFFAVTGLAVFQRLPLLRRKKLRFIVYALWVILPAVMIGYNWNLYFNQKPSEFIYYANQVPMLEVVDFIKRAADYKTTVVALNTKLYNDSRVQYFSDARVKKIELKIPANEASAGAIPLGIPTLIDVNTNIPLSQNLVNDDFQNSNHLVVRNIPPSPWGKIDTLIVFREQ